MKLLLDTHVWLWAVLTPERLAAPARTAIEDAENVVLVSAASAWEIATKHAIGKLPLPDSPSALLPRAITTLGAAELPISLRHAVAAASLPPYHRDPFDRLLVAQAVDEDAVLVTADHVLTHYGATLLWATPR